MFVGFPRCWPRVDRPSNMSTSQKLPTFWRQNFDGQKVGESLQKIDAGGLSNHLQLSNQKKTFHGFHELCATVKKKNL